MKHLALLVGVVLVALRVAAAADLEPFGDEAFYWQCARRPDVHYADHPFMTAMLVRAGTAVLGDGPLGIRAPFLLLGMALPFVVAALARALSGPRDAFWAGWLVLLLPGIAAAGTLATPDGPFLVLVALGLVCLERATRTDRRRWWLASGLVTALGLATHYRFALFPLAALLYLLSTSRGRSRWRRGGPWLAALAALPGLLPAALYNLRLDFEPLRYQLAARHGSPRGLSNLLDYFEEQALAAVTPVLYVALLATLVIAIRRARRGDDRVGLAAAFGAVWIGIFMVASPWSDSDNASAHWPLAGYLPLLAIVPGVLRSAWRAGGAARAIAGLAPATAILMVGLLYLGLATSALGMNVRGAFVGWDELAARVEPLLPDEPRPLVAADNYMTAAALELRLHDRADVYVLDHPKNDEHGRGVQYPLWGRDEAALREHYGRPALLVVETSAVVSAVREEVLQRIFSLFERPRWRCELVAEIESDGDIERHFALYTCTIR